MKVPYVDLRLQYDSMRGEIDKAIQDCLSQSDFVGGKPVEEFERAFSGYLGTKHCVGCGNGSDAIELALLALEIGVGDEVIVPALSWVATANAVVNVGSTPVFCDVIEGEYTIDPAEIEKRTSPKTRAIIPVHLYGLPARMSEIMDIARSKNLLVIEDAAQALGAEINHQKVGTFGDVATFSFYPGKNLGAYGDGGAVVTSKDDLAERIRRIGNHGQLVKHSHSVVGRNSRLDSIQAAILKVKLAHLDAWNEKRLAHAEVYRSSLPHPTQHIPEGYQHAYHIFSILLDDRDRVVDRLSSQGIGHNIHYPSAIPFTDAYQHQGHKKGDFPVAEMIAAKTLSIPLFPEMTAQQIEVVVKVLTA